MSLWFEPSPLFSTLSKSCADQYLWRVVWLSGVPQGTAPPPQGIKMPSVKTGRSNSLPEKQLLTISWFCFFSVFCSQCSEVWYSDFFLLCSCTNWNDISCGHAFSDYFLRLQFSISPDYKQLLCLRLKRGKTRRWQILTEGSCRFLHCKNCKTCNNCLF